MTKYIAFLAILAVNSSCSDNAPSEWAQVPWPGEWVPMDYSIGSDKTMHPIEDCANNFTEFSTELNEFASGNLLIGRIEACDTCPTFSGKFTWTSRCDTTNHYDGMWSTLDEGATVKLQPGSLPDSTLSFQARVESETGVRKLRYDIGVKYVTIRYRLERN